MHHAILGAGGLGGLVGGALARAQSPVTFILKPESLASHPNTLTVQSQVLGDFEAPVRLSTELPEPVDVLWVTVKAPQLEGALAAVLTDQLGSALVVPLMNGVEHMVMLRSHFNAAQVVAGTMRVEAERTAPGVIRQPSPFAVIRLAAVGEAASRIAMLAEEVRRTGLKCEVVDDEVSLLWSKLAFLAPLALTTTAMGAPLGAVRRDARWRARLDRCTQEACAVANAAGARVAEADIITMLHSAPDGMKSSMQKDVEAGRPPELDAIGGAIVRQGHAHHLSVPATEELMELVSARVGVPAERS